MIDVERGGELGAAENQDFGSAGKQMLAGGTEGGRVVREVAGLDAVVDDVHDGGLIFGVIGGEELDAAALERALVDAGLDGAVGREETGALDAAGLERVARDGDHVQNGDGDGRGDGVIKVVRGVAGHDEKIRADGLEALRALDHFGDGVGATVQEGCRAVGNIGIGVDAHARMVLIAGGSRVQGDLLKEVGGSERTHAAEDTDDLFITHGEAPFLSFRAAFDRDSGARRARGHAG